MCYKGKCMYCLKVETGALIFAIFNVIFTSLGSVLSIVQLIYSVLFVVEFIREHDVQPENNGQLMLSNLFFSGLAVGFCIEFAFAVVLIVGLCKKLSKVWGLWALGQFDIYYEKEYFILNDIDIVRTQVYLWIYLLQRTRRADLVKCYFYNGVTTMVCGAAIMLILVPNMDLNHRGPVLWVFIIHLLYGLILFMVRMTYKKFESDLSNPIATI